MLFEINIITATNTYTDTDTQTLQNICQHTIIDTCMPSLPLVLTLVHSYVIGTFRTQMNDYFSVFSKTIFCNKGNYLSPVPFCAPYFP